MNGAILVLALCVTGRFPEVVPTFRPMGGTLQGESLAVLTSPQQLIPGSCPSIVTQGEHLFVVVSGDSLLVRTGTPGGPWQRVTAVGPCDTVAVSLSFPALISPGDSPVALASIAQRRTGGVPYAFYQTLDPSSPDSCATGIRVTGTAVDTTGPAHGPALGIPACGASIVALSVWDPLTWNSYLFTKGAADTSFSPRPDAWGSALPRPDTLPGGPTTIAVGPSGELVACVLAEAGDSLHVGLQPWVSTSLDGGLTWSDLELVPAEAHGSAAESLPGRMPYGSFRGGTSWYAPRLVFAGRIPLLVWTARRAPADTLTPEERLWPGARAVLLSYPTAEGWVTSYVGRAMVDSASTYGGADWPTVVVEGLRATILWSDLSEDGTNLDVWACGFDVGRGSWTVPVPLTASTGSEAFLEVAGPLPGGEYALLCADAALLFGVRSPLVLSFLRVDPAWESGIRTDVAPAPARASPHPSGLALAVVPNPATGSFRLVSPCGPPTLVRIHDLAGRLRLVVRGEGSTGEPISVRGLPPGSYVVTWELGRERGAVPLVVR